jgi:MHS family proline/betaine transporter-like MFS transporter
MDMDAAKLVMGVSDSSVVAPRMSRDTVMAAIASTAGNVVEWFDFSIYAYFAPYIGKAFFPSASPLIFILSAFAVFGVGFAARPLGSVVCAHYSDKFGRRNVLATAILIMAGCSVAIGALPTYQTIGAAASVLLVGARLLQGFSTGGEFTGAGLFLVEHAPRGRRGTLGSYHQAGVGIGLFLGSMSATVLSTVLASQEVAEYGWRIPFIFGGVLGLCGLFLRRGVAETPHFQEARRTGNIASAPVKEALRTQRGKMLLVAGIFTSVTVNFYAFLTYLPTYATVVLHMSSKASFLANSIGLVVFAAVTLIAGRLSDRFGRRPLLIAHAGGIVLLTLPMFIILEHQRSFGALLAVQCIGSTLLGAFCGAGLIAALELVPTRFRYSAVAIPNSLVTSLLGGTAPFIATALVAATGNPIAITFYLIPASVISLVTYVLMPETSRVDMK